MTSWVVADSGILLANVLPEPVSAQAKAIWQNWTEQDIQVAAPTLLHYEFVAVMRKSVYRGTLSAADGIEARNFLLSQPIQLFISESLLKRGYDFATQFNLSTAYDAQYLAVAEHLQCEFWTADQSLYNILNASLAWVKWIGHYQRESGN
jgi:predicted nucleic acid-binding protein